MSRRWKILVIAAVALAAVVIIPVIRHYQLRAATEAYIAELKAKGEPMDLAQVIPPPVPAEQNGASNFLKAASLLDTHWNVLGSNPPPAMRMVAPGKAMLGWAQSDIRSRDGTNTWGEIEAALAEDNAALKLLSRITEHPILDFNLDYKDGPDKIKILHLASLKRSAQRLSAAAMDDLHRGDTASAVKDVSVMLALVNGASHDRLVISELVRIAITQITLAVNWEILQSPNLTDAPLAELQHDWMKLEFIRAEESAMALERVTGEISLTKWRNSNSELQNYFDAWFKLAQPGKEEGFFDRVRFKAQIFRWRYWWSYPDELRTLKGYQIFLETVRFAETNYSWQTAFQEQQNKVQKLRIDRNSAGSAWFSDSNKIDLHSLMSASVFSLNAVFYRVLRAETAKQMTETAIALKRYQLRHGSYPADLDLLVPEFMPAVPLDPVDGQPLRYRRNADGTFLLYSVGENGKDDGGDPSLENGVQSSSYYWQSPHTLDWVWPQPATPEAIQNFYEHPPK